MFVPPAPAWLSWNTARLIALIFNAFTGLVSYLDEIDKKAELGGLDSIVQLRILQGQLIELETAFSQLGYHPQIGEAVRQIGVRVGTIASEWGGGDKVEQLLAQSWRANFTAHRILNESYRFKCKFRWPLKEMLARGSNPEEPHAVDGWFMNAHNNESSTSLQHSLLHLIRGECELLNSNSVADILNPKGAIGFGTTRQLLLLYLAALSGRCNDQLNAYFSDRNLNTSEYVAERCVNIWDETLPFRRDKRVLARLTPQRLHLMMEQLLVCGGYGGFVEFANPHLLIMILSWQHPQLGCIAMERPEPMASDLHHLQQQHHPSSGGAVGVEQHSRADACLLDVSLAMGLSLAVFLRFLLDPGPWPEHHYPDQLVHFDYTVVAEEKFARYDYIKWVHDSNVPVQMSMDEENLVGARLLPGRPPPSSWSPDLIAFVLLLFVFVAGSVMAHHLFSNSNSRFRRVKQLYPYAFKKL